MLNFITHCGANQVERQALNAVQMPASTDTYAPLAYADFVDTVEDRLGDIGFRFGETAFAVNYRRTRRDGALLPEDPTQSKFFGIAELLSNNNSDVNALVVGLRSSLDQSLAPSVAFGSQVFVCDNLSFTGEVIIKRKQTSYCRRDITTMITDAVGKVSVMREHQEMRFEHYQTAQLRGHKPDALITELYRRGVVNASRMGKVIEEWDEPSHDFGGRTAWRMFNAVTEALKGAPVFEMPKRTIELQNLMDEASGFEIARAA